MTFSSKTFLARVPVGISFDADIQEYLASIVDGQSFTSLDSLREETEHFLIDAGLSDAAQLDAFYMALQADFSGSVKAASPTLVKIEAAKDDLKLRDSNKDNSASGSDTDSKPQDEAAKKPFKSKPVKMSKAQKKLAAKSPGSPATGSAGSGSGSPVGSVPVTGRDAFAGEGAIVEAYSQQSRFYEETIETLSKEVDLKQ
ncbi:hypothetical protein BG006_010177, partial [Podila minutissima]